MEVVFSIDRSKSKKKLGVQFQKMYFKCILTDFWLMEGFVPKILPDFLFDFVWHISHSYDFILLRIQCYCKIVYF